MPANPLPPQVWDRIELCQGDITRLAVDAIVNAANTSLLGGGGVDGAIHRAAGPQLLAECRALGGCPTGQAKMTRGYNLPSRQVIHTVGPVYHDGRHGEAEALRSCYRRSLTLAVEAGLRTVAFPAISCGVYRYPVEEAAGIALSTTAESLAATTQIDKVLFVLFSDEHLAVYRRTIAALRTEG